MRRRLTMNYAKILNDIKEACDEVKERNRGYEYFADDILAIIERDKE